MARNSHASYIESILDNLAGSMTKSSAAKTPEQIPRSLTALNIAKSQAKDGGSMMQTYLTETKRQQPWTATVYPSRLDIDSQSKDLASPVVKSYAAEIGEPKPQPLTESIIAKARVRPRSMMETYLAETQDQQPWRIPRSFRHGLSQITSPQDDQRNWKATTVTDNSTIASTDISIHKNFRDAPHPEKYEEEWHKHSAKEGLSVKQNSDSSLQTENTDESFGPLSSRNEDAESLLSSLSSSSLVSYAGEWSKLDQRFVELKLTPELPDAGAEVSLNTNFTAESQIGDIVRLDQDVAVLFAILSRNACPHDTPRIIDSSSVPTDAAPTNHASANGKAPDSSKKRSKHSKPKPKSRDNNNNNKGVDGESDSDDRPRKIRQKSIHGPLEEVGQRELACPFCKLHPQMYRRLCGEIHYPATSSGAYSLQVRAWDDNCQCYKSVQKQASANTRVQRHIFDKHGPFDPAIHESVAALPRLRPKERWRELCRICAKIDETLVPDDPCKLLLSIHGTH
jgi:hypothetical protein